MKKKLAVWMTGLLSMALIALPVHAESATQPLAIEPQFSYAFEFHEGLAAVEQNRKWGVIDRTGRFVVEPRYDWIEDFKDGFAYIGQPDDKGYNQVGLIDKTGKEIIPPLYYPLDRMSNGFWKAAKDDKYGVFDQNGNAISDFQYDYIGDFHDGLALVQKTRSDKRIRRTVDGVTIDYPDSLAGYIDETGKLVIPLQYDMNSGDFESGLAAVAKAGKWGVIDKKGKTVIPFQYDSVTRKYGEGTASRYFAVSKNRKHGAIDSQGKTVVPLKYDTAIVTSGDVLIYGMMRKNIVKFSMAKEANLIRDAKGNYHESDRGAIDLRTGKSLAPAQYDTIMEMRSGLLSVCKSNKCGVMNRSGKIVLPVKYTYISDLPLSFGGNFYIVYASDKLGTFNPTVSNSGNIPLYEYSGMAPLFSFAEDSREGLFRAVNKNKKVGVITDKGKEIVKAKYDEIGDFSEGFAAVKLNGKYGFIDRTGKEIVAPQYARAGRYHEGLAYVQLNGKYGYIDRSGREVIPPQFDDVRTGFSDGLASVCVNGKWGYIANPQTE
ncbi:WG repeat-containing protein [Cohnella caldifontis]|uniref:WG repeat-containing protein n=1 Tax=Cohnella caldifontis TaxID=3027471 RepID=UPI0023EDB690|nr:WG repeat-containing protein [Cohnella sp. YIM B05605]